MNIIIYIVPKWAKNGKFFSIISPKKLRQIRHLISLWGRKLNEVLVNRITNDMMAFVLNVFNIIESSSNLIPEECTFHELVANIAYYFPSKAYINYLIENDCYYF
jgi:hypothetical protein